MKIMKKRDRGKIKGNEKIIIIKENNCVGEKIGTIR
jgi:hypothetical protein